MHLGLGDILSDLKSRIIDQRAALRAATSVETKVAALTALLNSIGQLAAQYRTAGNEELVTRWMAQYRALQDAAAQARAMAGKGEAPSRIMVVLDQIGDRAIAVTDTVVRAAEGVVSGIGTTARLLPLLLPLALVAAVFVIGSGGLGGVLGATRKRSNPRRRRRRR
jgi:hypothetical protein